MFCSHFTQNCILLYFLEAKNPYFVTKNCWKSSYICVFILSKKRRNWCHKDLHNSGMVSRRKLPDLSLNHIFNALSIDVQFTLSVQLINFGLKCLTVRAFHNGFQAIMKSKTCLENFYGKAFGILIWDFIIWNRKSIFFRNAIRKCYFIIKTMLETRL